MIAPRESCACLDENQLLLLLDGALSGGAREAAEAHLDACAACRRLVGAAAPSDDPRASDAGRGPGSGPDRSLGRGASIGRYLVLSLLGRGGMGVVYAAYDADLDRRVALKFLHTARDSARARGLLIQEARLLGRLSHPNVIQVHDVGEHDGDVFVAMELVEGRSLDAWCRGAPRPGWREVLAAYLDAARGLSAAHDKGLVHRDVKPSNILRGEDGRVRIADFGLAAAWAAERRQAGEGTDPPAATAAPGPLDAAAATGAQVGTPLYMAPEQHKGLRATAASDQYSLCVALHEGLYGAPPFQLDPGAPPQAALAGLVAQKQAGPPAAPPAGAAVPAWVYRALARGLAPAPEDRYPSVGALIAALCDDPVARRGARIRAAGFMAAAAVLLLVAAAGWVRSGALRDPCAHPEQQLAGVWDEGTKGRVRAAFLGTGRPHAQGTSARVVAELDRYAAAWSAMRGEVCRASRSERAGIAELRDACLDRRRGQLQALSSLFAERPDPEVLDRAARAAAGLPPLAYCADTEALTARVRPPEDPALRARVAEIERRVDRLGALRVAGKYREGLAIGEPLLAEAEAIAYAPLLAQVRFRLGLLREGAGDYEGAKALLRAAAVSAAEGKDDILVASSWAWLLFIVGERQQHLEEAAVIEALGASVVARAQDERVRADWLNAAGLVQAHLGRRAEARAAHERVLAIKEKVLGPEHPDVSATLNNLANTLHQMGAYSQATAAYERALSISEKALGPEHPDVAYLIYNMGSTLDAMGAWPRSRSLLERALSIRERALHPDHPVLASSLTNLGSVRLHLGDAEGARSAYARALAIKEKALGRDDLVLSSTLAGLGRAELRLGRTEAARPLLERALALLEKARGASPGALVETLLGLGELALAEGQPGRAAALLSRAAGIESDEDFRCEVQLTRAEALWRSGRDRARARDLAAEALSAYRRLGHAPGSERAARWLAAHPPERVAEAR
jgi:serine/threonine-protein kinase